MLTIHGKSRFPGLFIWLRDGRRVPVIVPDGCLLLQVHTAVIGCLQRDTEVMTHLRSCVPCAQAGRQLEWLTGGHVKAGMHEVLFTPQTAAALKVARRDGRSTWRVSSTLFAHIASDQLLQPLGHFADAEGAQAYPPMPAGDYVEAELAVINLRNASDGAHLAL